MKIHGLAVVKIIDCRKISLIFSWEKGILRFTLSQLTDSDLTTIWSKEWKTTKQIGLRGEDALLCEGYILNLRSSHARIKEVDDEMIWNKGYLLSKTWIQGIM